MSLCVITLIVAHFFIIVQFDLKLSYLRVALFVLPLVFGVIYRDDAERRLLREFGAGLVVAVLSTLAMLTIVSKIDHVSIFPDDTSNGGSWDITSPASPSAFSPARCSGKSSPRRNRRPAVATR